MTNLKRKVLIATAALAPWCAAVADNVFLHTPDNFLVLSVSPNGQWACGVFMDLSGNTFGFRWNLDSGSIEMLGSDTSTAYDVANDGTVSGDFNDYEALTSGASMLLPGYWRDGRWHHLEMPEGNVADGMGYGISPDGRYMTGSIDLNGVYTPVIWKDGNVHRTIDVKNHGVAFAVSPDGSYAAGFETRYNRTACLWPNNGITRFFADSEEYSETPWNYARNFSPDGTKLVYWGGWEIDNEDNLLLYALYDLATGETTKVKAPALESDLEFYDVSNNGTLVGSDRGRGYVYADGNGMYIDEYLAMRNVDTSAFDDFYSGTDYYDGQLPINLVVAVSEDDKVMVMRYYDKDGNMCSMAVKMDQDLTKAVPAEVKAEQLAGLQTVALTWKRPIGATAVRGYNIYRDGVKINGFLPVNVPYYYDKNVSLGQHKYQVSAVMTNGSENRAADMDIEVVEQSVEAPADVFCRQKGINSAFVTWEEPFSNIAHKRYFAPYSTDFHGFVIYDPLVIEAAVKFDKGEMANYVGHKLTDVSFYPVAENSHWTINVYTYGSDGNLQLLASNPVTQPLVMNRLNTVKLDTPIDIEARDLVVAVEIGVAPDSNGLIGTDRERVVPGYSDLLRQKTDADFFSTFESSIESSYSITSMSWVIDLGLTPETYSEEANVVDHYNVYLGDENVGSTKETSFLVPALGAGEYKIGIDAVYADGRTSALKPGSIVIKPAYKAVEDVTVTQGNNTAAVTAVWQVPADVDTKTVSYVSDDRHSEGLKGVESTSYALMAAVEYPSAMLRGYDGYKIKSLRFYPLADAIFTFMLYQDGEGIFEMEVEDFTVGRWNEVELPEEILINARSKYRLVLDCFDPEPAVKLLGIDTKPSLPYISDLYSVDYGESWGSFSEDTGLTGNWMLGMVLADTETGVATVTGYDVVIDGNKCNNAMILDTEYTHDFGTGDDKDHTLRVDAYYPALLEAVEGGKTTFHLSVAGIGDSMIADITLHAGDNELTVDGEGVSGLTVVSAAGVEVARSDGNTVGISHLSPGVYIVTIETSAGTVIRKINIR